MAHLESSGTPLRAHLPKYSLPVRSCRPTATVQVRLSGSLPPDSGGRCLRTRSRSRVGAVCAAAMTRASGPLSEALVQHSLAGAIDAWSRFLVVPSTGNRLGGEPMVAAVTNRPSIIPTVRNFELDGDGYYYVKGSAERRRASRWHGAKDGASVPTHPNAGGFSPNLDCDPAPRGGFLAGPRPARV